MRKVMYRVIGNDHGKIPTGTAPPRSVARITPPISCLFVLSARFWRADRASHQSQFRCLESDGARLSARNGSADDEDADCYISSSY